MIPKESITSGLQEVVDFYVKRQKDSIGDFNWTDEKDNIFTVLNAFRYVFPWIRWHTKEEFNSEFSVWYIDDVFVAIEGEDEETDTADFNESDFTGDLEEGFNPYLGCYDYDC